LGVLGSLAESGGIRICVSQGGEGKIPKYELRNERRLLEKKKRGREFLLPRTKRAGRRKKKKYQEGKTYP